MGIVAYTYICNLLPSFSILLSDQRRGGGGHGPLVPYLATLMTVV